MREKSTSDLTAAIRSPEDKRQIDAMILDRANTVINLGYVPDWTPKERAAALDEFRKALRRFPQWAVERAFDEWVRTNPRRPSPAEIAILVQRQVRPVTDELARRRKAEQEQAEEERSRKASRPSAADAQEILNRAGFTPKRVEAIQKSRTPLSLEAVDDPPEPERPRHWTQDADPEGPEMQELRRARDENPLVKAARERQARDEAKKRAAE